MAGWTDAHNHLQDPRLGGDLDTMVATARAAGVSRCVVNSTREEDWDAVEEIAVRHPGFAVPAFGIHPWHAHRAAEGWEKRLLDRLRRHPVASVGECGIDQWVSEPDVSVQMPVFHAQLRIARETKRPVTIHCLKAWGLLFDAFKAEPPPDRFLLHSYGGSIETARRLVPLGAFFSFSGHFLHERKRAVLDVFKQLPRDRILLETDAPDMIPPPASISHPLSSGHNHPANLTAVGSALARALGMNDEDMRALTAGNAARCFGFGSEREDP
jgi:TatD DNase family protein